MEPIEESSGNMVQDPRSIKDLGDLVESFVAVAKGTMHAERNYLSFMLAKRVAGTVRQLTGSILTFVLGGLAVLLASIGCAFLVGQHMGNIAWGFGCIAVFYGLLAFLFSRWWKGSLGRSFTVTLINNFHGH